MHSQFTWNILLRSPFSRSRDDPLLLQRNAGRHVRPHAVHRRHARRAPSARFEHHFFPHLTGSIGSYALVGMGVLFAAFLRAPLTSVFMVLEVSGNYSIILPVILANTIAYLLSRALQPVPVFEIFTHQDGLDLPSMEEQREESDLHIEDALEPWLHPILKGADTPAAILKATKESAPGVKTQHATPVILIQCSDSRWYAARLYEIEKFAAPQANKDPATSIETLLGNERTPMLFPDQPLDTALHHLSRWPVLPVTNRSRRGALEGVVNLEGVLKRYQQFSA